MRVRASCLLAVLVVASVAAPVALSAGLPQAGGAVTLYLRSLQAPFGSLGAVETLSDEPPVNTNDTARNVTASAAWFAVPGAPREFGIGDLAGTVTFQVVGSQLPVLGVSFQSDITYQLLKVAVNGTQVEVGNATSSFTTTFSAVDALAGTPVPSGPVNQSFTIAAPANVTLAPGETLGLNITGTATAPAAPLTDATGVIQLLYDSTIHPGSLNVTLPPVARGNLQLSAGTLARDAAPGSSPTYTVTVRNAADQPDTVRLNASGNPGWTIRLTPSQTSIPAGSSVSILMTVVVPSDATEGTRHTATLTATSSLGAAPQTLTFTTTVRATTGTAGDTDGDGWTDLEERRYSSNPNDRTSTPDSVDSDGDGFSNRAEIDAGTDAFDPSDVPGSTGNQPGGSGVYTPIFGGFTTSVAQSLGSNEQTADLAILGVILLFILILILLYLLLRGYPVKVAFAQPRATTEPGRPVDYTVEVRSLRRQPQIVDLEIAELPGDWDARLSQPRVSLEPKQRQTIGLLVRPPDAWPAPSKREFIVRARSRLKPGKFARAIGRLSIQPRGEVAPPPSEEGVREPAAWPEEGPTPEAVQEAAEAGQEAFAPAPAPPRAGGPFRIAISDVKHTPEVPERGGEVTTTARVDNRGTAPERVRLVLVVNGKVRDEVTTELGPGEGAEAEFHWVAYLARNEVRVVAERA